MDEDQIKGLLKGLERDPDFVAAKVVDKAGKVTSDYAKSSTAADDIVATAAIERQGNPLGTLELHLPHHALSAAFRDNLLSTVTWYGIMLVFVLGGVWVDLEQHSRPFGEVARRDAEIGGRQSQF